MWSEKEEEEEDEEEHPMIFKKIVRRMKRELERRKVEIQQSGPEQWMELRWIEHGNAEIAAIFQKYFD